MIPDLRNLNVRDHRAPNITRVITFHRPGNVRNHTPTRPRSGDDRKRISPVTATLPISLICMQGCGVILPHHIVAEVDRRKSDEFRDVQYLHIAETGKASADARKQRANGNENVAEETGSSLVRCEILDGRVDGAAKQKNEGVEVEQGRKCPDPLPCKHSSREAMIEALRNFNRGDKTQTAATTMTAEHTIAEISAKRFFISR